MSTLPSTTAEDVWMACGPHAKAGHPLPEGHLPIAIATDRIALITPDEWNAYEDIRSFTQPSFD
jgi:hypothetical protein